MANYRTRVSLCTVRTCVVRVIQPHARSRLRSSFQLSNNDRCRQRHALRESPPWKRPNRGRSACQERRGRCTVIHRLDLGIGVVAVAAAGVGWTIARRLTAPVNPRRFDLIVHGIEHENDGDLIVLDRTDQTTATRWPCGPSSGKNARISPSAVNHWRAICPCGNSQSSRVAMACCG